MIGGLALDPMFGSVAVYFVGGKIIAMGAGVGDMQVRVHSAVPLELIRFVFSFLLPHYLYSTCIRPHLVIDGVGRPTV